MATKTTTRKAPTRKTAARKAPARKAPARKTVAVETETTETAPKKKLKISVVGTTREGFKRVKIGDVTAVFDPELFNDIELVEMLGELQNGKVLTLPTLLLKVLGGDEAMKQKLYDQLRLPTGRVPADAAGEFIFDLMQVIAPKSPTSQD